MTAYSATEAERLVREAREDDKRMSVAPWSYCGASDGECPCGLIWAGHQNDTVARTYSAENDTHGRSVDGHAIARTRNNLRALADQLDAARGEIERQRGLADKVADHLLGLHDKQLGEAITDRDRLAAEVERLRALWARYSIHGSPTLAIVAERDQFRAKLAALALTAEERKALRHLASDLRALAMAVTPGRQPHVGALAVLDKLAITEGE